MDARHVRSRGAMALVGASTALLLFAGAAAALSLPSGPLAAQGRAIYAAPPSSPALTSVPPGAGRPVPTTIASPSTTPGAPAEPSVQLPVSGSLPPSSAPLIAQSSTTAVGKVPSTTPTGAPTSSTLPGRSSPLATEPGSWSSTADGITTTLHMSPTKPRVGQPVHFSITVNYGQLGCCDTFFYPGDGAVIEPDLTTQHPCFESPVGVMTEEVDHVYTEPGAFVVEVQPSVVICKVPAPIWTPAGPVFIVTPGFISAWLYANIYVEPAA